MGIVDETVEDGVGQGEGAENKARTIGSSVTLNRPHIGERYSSENLRNV